MKTATVKQIDALAAAARELRRVRAEALPKLKGGLRTLELTRSRPLARPSRGLLRRKIPFAVSQTAQVPGANPLQDAHAALDTAVLTAYGFSAKKETPRPEPRSSRED